MGGGATAGSQGEGAAVRPAAHTLPWTSRDDLQFLCNKTFIEIAEDLGRTLSAVRQRAVLLRRRGVKLKVRRRVAGRPWHNEEYAELFAAGYSNEEIALMTGRKVGSVERQRFRLKHRAPVVRPIRRVPGSGEDWWMQGACRYVPDPDIFFPINQQSDIEETQEALSVCRSCPVLAECREYILRFEVGRPKEQRYGIWAAMTPADREKQR